MRIGMRVLRPDGVLAVRSPPPDMDALIGQIGISRCRETPEPAIVCGARMR